VPDESERPSFIGAFGVAIVAAVALAGLLGGVAAARCSSGSPTPKASPPLAQLPVARIRSVTFYEERPFAAYADDVVKALPRLKATGFNTVWLVLPWYEFEPKPLADKPVYDDASFSALRTVLAALRAQRLHALIGLNYLGQGWSPEGIDPCRWIENPQMEGAFEAYVRGFLARIDAYHDVPSILFFTETAQLCDSNPVAHAASLAARLQTTLGSIPARLPRTLRSDFRFGYHDNSLLSLGWSEGVSPIAKPDPFDFLSMSVYGLEGLRSGAIVDDLDSRVARFRAFDRKAPLLFGEVGASRCSGGLANQVRVERSVLGYAVRRGIGFNVWHWRPVADENTCKNFAFRALALTQATGALNATGRAVQTILAHATPPTAKG
jgi:hypothetical protein